MHSIVEAFDSLRSILYIMIHLDLVLLCADKALLIVMKKEASSFENECFQ